ncbi:hypothetical protein [Hyalangium rubrum]|uniref:Outer membrane protein beta-barrel domain-containing protein n=1 Tax=Hyalangium rubrum TaxID=3103134 RepID=A0ABU5H9R0_9BACT|nr:hypothetical protein [Hyalangium sp. s54d21]MDY7230055.1 hypothetical protein [Hyalangium sp. s54d21]
MLDFRNLLCAALAASLLFSASEAEARFGKRSPSSDSEKKEDKEDKDDKKQERRNPSQVHDASGVGSHSPPPPPPPPPQQHVVIVEQPAPTYYVSPPPDPEYAARASAVIAERESSVYRFLRFGIGGGPMGGGAGLDLFLAVEGERLGLDGRVTGLSLPTDDGTEGTDGITVAGAHLTYALVAAQRLHWRVEAGISTARAPSLIVTGPSLGTSFDARLVHALDFESRVQVTPLPYRQLDAQAGLAWKPYPWVLRAGWRALVLDDAGLVDGVVHRDVFNGPYFGVGVFF